MALWQVYPPHIFMALWQVYPYFITFSVQYMFKDTISLFATTSSQAPRPIKPPIQWEPGSLSMGAGKIKQKEDEANCLPSSIAEVKNIMELYLHATYILVKTFMVGCLGTSAVLPSENYKCLLQCGICTVYYPCYLQIYICSKLTL